MNSLNLSFKNINAARRDELGYISPGSGVSSGKALTVPKSNYYVPPPPIFNQTRYVSPGSGVSSGAGLGINPANDQNDALQVLNAANSRGNLKQSRHWYHKRCREFCRVKRSKSAVKTCRIINRKVSFIPKLRFWNISGKSKRKSKTTTILTAARAAWSIRLSVL